MKSKLLPTLAAWAFLFAAFVALARAADRQPNFLFVYTDDQRWDAMGVVQREHGERGRYPWFTTPAMDRLAAEGLRFRHAFVTLSLCAPSRAAFLTGRYNHLNGVANNHTPFPVESVTHATLLRAAGYTTGYIGKWHMGGQRGQRPGFDYSASFIGQGRYTDCPFEINGEATPTTGWVDDVSTDYAIAFMRENRAKPFSLIVGFKACHGPTTPPARAANRFADQKARRVPSLGLRAPFRDEADIPATKAAPPASAGNEVAVNLNYFRCVSAADDCLGRLLTTLDELGLTEDTVVIFSSDNGYYQGEHNLGDKRSLYDESIRIPLLVRYPRLVAGGRITDELVLNIDLAPTLLDLARVRAPNEMQGRSWIFLLVPPPVFGLPPLRDAFLSEYFQETGYPQTPTMTAVRTADAKLIKYLGREEWTELFDLRADPYETKNLARDPAHRDLLARMTATFDREAKAVGYVVPVYADKPSADDGAGKKKGGKNKQKAP